MEWQRLFRYCFGNFWTHGLHARGVVGHELSLFVDQEFIEIPTYGSIEGAIFGFVAQPTIQGMLAAAFDIQLFADGEGDAIVFLAERGNFLCAAGFLFHELVARTSDDHQFVCKFLLQLLKFGVLGGVTAFGSGIHDQNLFALVGSQAERGCAIQRFQWDIVYAFGGSCYLRWVDGFRFTKNAGCN